MTGVVSALIVNDKDEIFVQKRSSTRKLFPNCWDLVGGHVEPKEGDIMALARETFEETGWHIKDILHEIEPTSWLENGAPVIERMFIVRVDGNLLEPRIEEDKVSCYRWVGATDDCAFLKENRAPGDYHTYNAVQSVFKFL